MTHILSSLSFERRRPSGLRARVVFNGKFYLCVSVCVSVQEVKQAQTNSAITVCDID